MTRLPILLTFFVFSFTMVGQDRVLPSDTMVKTDHMVTIGDQRFAYTAETGTQPVWDEDGKGLAARSAISSLV